ncbi:MAG: recombination-associated protein RdgC, partial [Luteibacter sp.]
FDDRISFVLGEDLILRKIKFTDVVLDEQGDSPESAAAEMDANFTLMAGEYARLLGKLEEWFKLPRPE